MIANELKVSEQSIRKLLAEERIKGRKLWVTRVILELSYKKKKGVNK